jgi:hypothetical protein
LTPSSQSVTRQTVTTVAHDNIMRDSANLQNKQELMEKLTAVMISPEDTFRKLFGMQIGQRYARMSYPSRHCDKAGVKSPVIADYMATLESLRQAA